MKFPPSDEWLGLIVFVFAAMIVLNSLTRRVPALANLESGF
jgi:hypothetical protein